MATGIDKCYDRSIEVKLPARKKLCKTEQPTITSNNNPNNQTTDQHADMMDHREVTLPINLLIYVCIGIENRLRQTSQSASVKFII